MSLNTCLILRESLWFICVLALVIIAKITANTKDVGSHEGLSHKAESISTRKSARWTLRKSDQTIMLEVILLLLLHEVASTYSNSPKSIDASAFLP